VGLWGPQTLLNNFKVHKVQSVQWVSEWSTLTSVSCANTLVLGEVLPLEYGEPYFSISCSWWRSYCSEHCANMHCLLSSCEVSAIGLFSTLGNWGSAKWAAKVTWPSVTGLECEPGFTPRVLAVNTCAERALSTWDLVTRFRDRQQKKWVPRKRHA
jgi:hypothetical protein